MQTPTHAKSEISGYVLEGKGNSFNRQAVQEYIYIYFVTQKYPVMLKKKMSQDTARYQALYLLKVMHLFKHLKKFSGNQMLV